MTDLNARDPGELGQIGECHAGRHLCAGGLSRISRARNDSIHPLWWNLDSKTVCTDVEWSILRSSRSLKDNLLRSGQ
jgi:hypothetical protein